MRATRKKRYARREEKQETVRERKKGRRDLSLSGVRKRGTREESDGADEKKRGKEEGELRRKSGDGRVEKACERGDPLAMEGGVRERVARKFPSRTGMRMRANEREFESEWRRRTSPRD